MADKNPLHFFCLLVQNEILTRKKVRKQILAEQTNKIQQRTSHSIILFWFFFEERKDSCLWPLDWHVFCRLWQQRILRRRRIILSPTHFCNVHFHKKCRAFVAKVLESSHTHTHTHPFHLESDSLLFSNVKDGQTHFVSHSFSHPLSLFLPLSLALSA